MESATDVASTQLTEAIGKRSTTLRLPALHVFIPPTSPLFRVVLCFISERMVVFHAHMKGLFALQYPLTLSACAIEHNHVPSMQDDSQSGVPRARAR